MGFNRYNLDQVNSFLLPASKRIAVQSTYHSSVFRAWVYRGILVCAVRCLDSERSCLVPRGLHSTSHSLSPCCATHTNSGLAYTPPCDALFVRSWSARRRDETSCVFTPFAFVKSSFAPNRWHPDRRRNSRCPSRPEFDSRCRGAQPSAQHEPSNRRRGRP